MAEQVGIVTMNEKGTRDAATRRHSVKRCGNDSSVIPKTVFELKKLSTSPGSNSNEELFWLAFALSNP